MNGRRERSDREVDKAVVDAIIEFAIHRLSGTSDAVPADVVASLPAAFQEQYEALYLEGTESIPDEMTT